MPDIIAPASDFDSLHFQSAAIAVVSNTVSALEVRVSTLSAGGGGSVTSNEASAISAQAASAISVVKLSVNAVSNALSALEVRVSALSSTPAGVSVTSTELSIVSAQAASALSQRASVLSQAISVVSVAAANALSVANAASNAASNALSVANAVSQALSVLSAGQLSILSQNVSVLSQQVSALSQAVSVMSTTLSNLGSVVTVAMSQAISVLSQQVSVLSQAMSVISAGLGTVQMKVVTNVQGISAVSSKISGLSVSIAANGVYELQGKILYSTSGTANVYKFGMSVSAVTFIGIAGQWDVMVSAVNNEGTLSTGIVLAAFNTIAGAQASALPGTTGAVCVAVLNALAAISTTGGTLRIESGASATASPINIMKGSFIRAHKIA